MDLVSWRCAAGTVGSRGQVGMFSAGFPFRIIWMMLYSIYLLSKNQAMPLNRITLIYCRLAKCEDLSRALLLCDAIY